MICLVFFSLDHGLKAMESDHFSGAEMIQVLQGVQVLLDLVMTMKTFLPSILAVNALPEEDVSAK